ncbi:MAG: type II toxin-antitoxin system VapC family toxin [Planctomycetales bacterium]|nr:type II toxin-antitoxin system VapC family toxin [Planctomycetales bacterium]
MFILDSDHMSLLEWGGQDSAALRERLADLPEDQLATTIVCYEEQMRGWMAYIARASSINRQLEAYRRLRAHLDNYRQIPVLDFDDIAAEEYQRLRRTRLRIGTMDLKIASIVLSRGDTLLSRNIVDFSKVPGLKVEDWT